MIAHGPSGCQVSVMRWPGRSEAMVRPYKLARQADGEIADVDHLLHFAEAFRRRSCRPPASRARPSASFEARNSSPSRRTSSPRLGAGTSRQARKAFCARSMIPGMSAAGVSRTRAISAPSIGERTDREPPESAAAVRPKRSRMSPVVMGWLIRCVCVSASGPAGPPRSRWPLFDPKSARAASPALAGNTCANHISGPDFRVSWTSSSRCRRNCPACGADLLI